VYSKGGSGKAASGRVLKYENQKGYAAALWAYKNGITDPGVFDRMTEAEKVDFMNGRTNPETGELEPGAIQHAKEMNNPAPKGPKYQVNTDTGTILGENTLEFAKAHLRKLVADGGPRPATAPETVERLRGAAGEPTAAETVEGMRPEPPSLLQQVGEALKEETGSVGPGSGASKELRQALREKARTTVERLRDYTWLLPPPEGERVSPLRAGMQDYPEAGSAKQASVARRMSGAYSRTRTVRSRSGKSPMATGGNAHRRISRRTNCGKHASGIPHSRTSSGNTSAKRRLRAWPLRGCLPIKTPRLPEPC
jgi:hypothetical protein